MKIGFSLAKLSLKCSYKEGVLENVVTGIQMRGNRVQPAEPSIDLISEMDLQVDCGEIMVSIFKVLIPVFVIAMLAKVILRFVAIFRDQIDLPSMLLYIVHVATIFQVNRFSKHVTVLVVRVILAQILRENNQSFLEILKVAVAGSLEFPAEVRFYL